MKSELKIGESTPDLVFTVWGNVQSKNYMHQMVKPKTNKFEY